MRMFQVDAFTDRLFAGNPAAVLVLDDWLPDDLMLAVAQENNLAETAFVKARADGAWDLRWFAPAHEVDFCGHATLATAHVLLTQTEAEAPLVFHTRVGELRVSKVANGYRLDLPRLAPEPLEALPAEVAGIFSEPPVHIFRNFENIFVDLGSADAVRRFIPRACRDCPPRPCRTCGDRTGGQWSTSGLRITLLCPRCRNSRRSRHRVDPCHAGSLLVRAVEAKQADGVSGVLPGRMA